MRAVLTELEANLRTNVSSEEPTLPDLSALDIDHIMPQSWFEHWPLGDGSLASDSEVEAIAQLVAGGLQLSARQTLIHERQTSIHTMGNLSLLNLKVNREAQNFSFARKRDLLIQNTTLRLNVPLIARQTWDESAIASRGAELADAALAIWPGPRT